MKNTAKIVWIVCVTLLMSQLYADPLYNEIEINENVNVGYSSSSAVLNNGNVVTVYGLTSMGFSIYTPEGVKVGNEVSYPSRYEPFFVKSLNDGNFMTICRKAMYEIVVQIFSPQGVPVGDELWVNDDSFRVGAAIFAVKQLSNGNYVVIWIDKTEASDLATYRGYIYGQIIDQNGEKVGEKFEVDKFGSESKAYGVQLVALHNGGFMIGWAHIGGFYAIQFYDSEGDYTTNRYQGVNWSNIRFLLTSDDYILLLYTRYFVDGYKLQMSRIRNQGHTFQDPVTLFKDDECNRYSSVHLVNGDLIFAGVMNDTIVTSLVDTSSLMLKSETALQVIDDHHIYHANMARLDNKMLVYWNYSHSGNPRSVEGVFVDFNNVRMTKPYVLSNSSLPFHSIYNPHVVNLHDSFMMVWIKEYAADPKVLRAKIFPSNLGRPLVPFSLISPGVDSTLKTSSPEFRWHPGHAPADLPEEIHPYKLYLSQDEAFTDPLIFPVAADTTVRLFDLEKGTTWFWKVLAKSNKGDSLWSEETIPFFISHTATDIKDDVKSPESFTLSNYPNPFNPSTTFNIQVPAKYAGNDLVLNIYNIQGQRTKSFTQPVPTAGDYRISWNAVSDADLPIASGTYFAILRIKDAVIKRKVLYLK